MEEQWSIVQKKNLAADGRAFVGSTIYNDYIVYHRLVDILAKVAQVRPFISKPDVKQSLCKSNRCKSDIDGIKYGSVVLDHKELAIISSGVQERLCWQT